MLMISVSANFLVESRVVFWGLEKNKICLYLAQGICIYAASHLKSLNTQKRTITSADGNSFSWLGTGTKMWQA
jgi:hypothetical protein